MTPDQDRLVHDHMWLAERIADSTMRRLPRHADPDDIRSAALLGLVEAATRYTTDHGATFATYARPRINGAITDHLRRLDWAPRLIREQIRAGHHGHNQRARILSIDELQADVADQAADPAERLLATDELDQLHQALDTLPDRLRHVVDAHYWHNQPLTDIGPQLGVKGPRASQLKTEAITRLRARLAA